MKDDGNCQFRALSYECFGDQTWHLCIRRHVCDLMAARRGDFEAFFPTGEFDVYLRGMRRPGTWGDELTLRAAADLLDVSAFVVTSEEENWLLKYEPSSDGGEATRGVRTIFLAYISPIHYNAIEPITSELDVSTGSRSLLVHRGKTPPQDSHGTEEMGPNGLALD